MELFGIKNCDTVKKARKWLDAHAIDYVFSTAIRSWSASGKPTISNISVRLGACPRP